MAVGREYIHWYRQQLLHTTAIPVKHLQRDTSPHPKAQLWSQCSTPGFCTACCSCDSRGPKQTWGLPHHIPADATAVEVHGVLQSHQEPSCTTALHVASPAQSQMFQRDKTVTRFMNITQTHRRQDENQSVPYCSIMERRMR